MGSFARQAAGDGWQSAYLAGLLLLLYWLPGCRRSEDLLAGTAILGRPSRVLSGRPVSGHSFIVGISLPAKDRFYRAVRSGMEKAAAENLVSLDIRSAEPAAGDQSRQVEDLIARRVDALVVWCPDVVTAGAAVKEANIAGAPVFTVGAETHQGSVAAHFAPAVLMANTAMNSASAQLGKTLVNKIARYLRGEKLKPYIIIQKGRGGEGSGKSTVPSPYALPSRRLTS